MSARRIGEALTWLGVVVLAVATLVMMAGIGYGIHAAVKVGPMGALGVGIGLGFTALIVALAFLSDR